MLFFAVNGVLTIAYWFKRFFWCLVVFGGTSKLVSKSFPLLVLQFCKVFSLLL